MHMVDDLKLVYPLSLGVPHDQEKGQSELELNSFLSFFMSLHIYIYIYMRAILRRAPPYFKKSHLLIFREVDSLI